ncbi:putative baseplate assembly protein [Paenibacillus sp. M1]|uniref:Baseplate assembly protein n=1 Tax=Paenibacillus haidiansis TaxID=1574488 RepID=A0ABU7VVF5_9BACL
MGKLVPYIDRRNQEDLVPELRRIIYRYCGKEWDSLPALEADKKAETLVRIFSRMMENVIERLNKAPEKNFIAFLNLLGIGPTPPRAAKAPLLVKAKDDWDKLGFLPAGTKVSAQPENQEEVIFETEKGLTVIQPRPVRAVSLDPGEDRWSNQDFLLSEERTGKFAELFQGDSTVVHRLYLGHSQLLSFDEPGNQLTVYFNKPGVEGSPEGSEEPLLDMDWYCFDEEGNARRLNVTGSWHSRDSDWSAAYIFADLSGIYAKTVSGYDSSEERMDWTNKWIFAELKTPITSGTPMPDIEEIRMELGIVNPEALHPDKVLSNGTEVDVSKDFYPFGEKPKVNDTFYIACREAFAKEHSNVSLTVELSDPEISKPPDTSYVKLSWEYWNGSEWTAIENLQESTYTLAKSVEEGEPEQPESLCTVETLTASGTMHFECPGIKACVVNGEENYWIRIRITGGNYGEEDKYDYEDTPIMIGDQTVNIAQLQYTKATFAPPSVHNLVIDYSYTVGAHPEKVLTENNFTFRDTTEECLTENSYFKPFYPCTERDPMFYLAFDRDISDLPVSLFFPLTGEQLGENPIVAWEYWNGRKWMTLSVNDALRHFTRREILQLAIPSDIEPRPLFGTEQYWIRARLDEGTYRVFPQIDAIYSNAVWARHSNTITGEILGSSNGEGEQSFTLSKTPVLPGQVLMVREAAETGDWVPWEEVSTFSLSGSDGRHYILDRSTGTIQFGDGKNGMVPPTGIDNLKCDYKHGGGSRGNVEAASITKVWDSFSWLDSVTNPVAADGGFDREEPEQAEIRGPHTLKSWERGVTAEDMEWLVREAMPQIAKVKCLSTVNRDLEFAAGKATVIVVPDSDEPKPMPSQELLGEIEAYLCERMSAVLDTSVPGIEVIGPDYVRIGIDANVTFTSMEQRKVVEGQIIDNLKAFFHPLTGGDGNTGWDLGKNLYVSEVYSVIKNTPGVDYVSDIAAHASVQCLTLRLEPLEKGYYKPIVNYPKASAVRTDDNTILFSLAEQVEAGTGVKTLMVKGFKENEKIRLRYRNYDPVELRLDSMEGDLLECSTVNGEGLPFDYPEGSDLEYDVSDDFTVRTFIMNEVPKGAASFYLKIALFEPKDIVFLSRTDEYVNTTPLKIHEVRSENIFLEEDELIYGGFHFINKKEELVFPYLLDKENDQIHDLSGTVAECGLENIPKEERKYTAKLPDTEPLPKRCPYCFPMGE